ncbi:hypothetical protein RB195_016734 [Necator americanus]|uniref:Uncharacterized protein n=1 Tax=Necator americanus TaxID=51031 RepID=A0ABR1C460_NECAM
MEALLLVLAILFTLLEQKKVSSILRVSGDTMVVERLQREKYVSFNLFSYSSLDGLVVSVVLTDSKAICSQSDFKKMGIQVKINFTTKRIASIKLRLKKPSSAILSIRGDR